MPAALMAKPPRQPILPRSSITSTGDTIETRLWIEEHDWLYALLKSEHNIAPTFRIPDLISACVSSIFAHDDAATRIFRYLGADLVLRAPDTPRRRESMWTEQYKLLLAIQQSAANRHPHPKFQLDQLTTACVALCRQEDATGSQVLRQARLNVARRITHGVQPHSTS